jgi:tetratricopeptide (TPR) repeat protein
MTKPDARRLRPRIARAVAPVIAIALLGCAEQQPALKQTTPSPAPNLPGAEAAVRAEIKRLQTGDSRGRWEASMRLAAMGPVARTAVPDLLLVVTDHDVEARKAAITALGEIGPDARDALPLLRKLLQESDPSTRARIESAVRRISHDDRVLDAIRRLEGRDASARLGAILDLLADVPDVEEAVPALIAVMAWSEPTVRVAAIRILAQVASLSSEKAQRAGAALDQHQNDADPAVKAAIDTALAIRTMYLRQLELFNGGDYDRSIAQAAQLLAFAEHHVGSLVTSAMAHIGADRLDLARQALDRVIELMPRHAEAYQTRAGVLALQGSSDAAIADVNRAQLLDPSLRQIHVFRAILFRERKEYDLAMEDMHEWMRLAAEPSERQTGFVIRASISLAAGSIAAALADLDSAATIDSLPPDGHYYRGTVLERLGRRQDAEHAYRRFAESDVDSHPSREREAWLRIRQRFGYPVERRPRSPARP